MPMQKQPLSDEQVWEIVRLHEDQGQTLEQIAVQFDRALQTIQLIVKRKTYRHVTDPDYHRRRKCNSCPDCVRDRRREQNAIIGETAHLTGVCVQCGEAAHVKVKTLLAHPGRILCSEHDKRRGTGG